MLSAVPSLSLQYVRSHCFLAGLVCVFACFFLQYSMKIRHADQPNRSAFLRWRGQLAELSDGVNVWDKYAYPNPPIMALILRPFHALPPFWGAATWFLCKAALALAAIWAVLSLLDASALPFPLWGKLLAVLAALRPIEGDLVHGNVNLFVLALVVACLVAFHRRRDGIAGVLLGLAIACKLTPALFLGYFLWKRAWCTLGAATASLAAFSLILPALFLGWQDNLTYLQSWHEQMVAPYAAGVVTSEHKNQSLPGVLYRMLSDSPSFSGYEEDRKIILDTHNIASLPRPVIQGVIIACMGGFVALSLWHLRSGCVDRDALVLAAEFGIVVLGMLLFCERTWKHHCVTLLIPFAVSAYCVSAAGFARSLRWQVGVPALVALLLLLLTTSGIFDRHVNSDERVGKLAQVYGAYVWAFLLLLFAMCRVLVTSSLTAHRVYDAVCKDLTIESTDDTDTK
ncbi:MAG: DUF2029 domain-containing protein [Gemmataceae bacterium]|nr:DUF2029 domain-containing protein [Gemmataceae bacterium]